MKTPQAIFMALLAALALAAFLAFYDSYKPDTEMARYANEAPEKTDLLTPASSIAHDFAVCLLPIKLAVADEPACLATERQPICTCDVTKLRPLQGAVGMKQVTYIENRIAVDPKHGRRRSLPKWGMLKYGHLSAKFEATKPCWQEC
jgi:hypothetical protein